MSLFVKLASACISECIHAVDLILGADPTEVVDLADGPVHALLDLFERDAEEALAAEDLGLLGHIVLSGFVERSFPLRDANEHVFLGLVEGEDSSTFSTLNDVDDGLGRWRVHTEDTPENVLVVECREQGDVPTDANTHDKELIGTSTHDLDLALNNLLDVGVALRLKQVLALVVPGAALALVALLEDDGALDRHNIDKLVEAEQSIRSLAEERVDVLLRALAVIVQEDARGVSWIHQTAIGSGHRLEDNVVAYVVLEQSVLSDWFSGFFSAHFILV